MNTRTTAALIAFLGGAFGIQWFILNKPAFGILSIFLFWTTIPIWIAWYHIITFLIMDDEKFEEKYGIK